MPTSDPMPSLENAPNPGTEGLNNREREHQVLQEVLNLLATPILEDNDFNDKDRQINELKLQNRELRDVLSKMASLLRDRAGQCLTLERKSSALTLQANSLKEVISITKDLLNIRNAEVQHLQEDISKLDVKLGEERERHNTIIEKMNTANELNSKLRKEYETQLELFQSLREQYERRAKLMEKVDSTTE